MSARGCSPKTIADLHGLFSAAMSTAVRLGHRADNPCVGVELPKSQATRDDTTVLTQDEFALLLLLVATGLRWGEATALTVADLDLTSRPASVRVTKAGCSSRGRRARLVTSY